MSISKGWYHRDIKGESPITCGRVVRFIRECTIGCLVGPPETDYITRIFEVGETFVIIDDRHLLSITGEQLRLNWWTWWDCWEVVS